MPKIIDQKKDTTKKIENCVRAVTIDKMYLKKEIYILLYLYIV